LGHTAVNQFNEGYSKLYSGKLKDFICKTTTYGDVIADIQTYRNVQDRSASDLEDKALNQQDYRLNNDPPPSEISSPYDSKSDSGTSSSSSSAQSQESLDEDDPSNNHLVSGSDYSMHISEGRLIHKAWYDESWEDNLSDEEEEVYDFDSNLASQGENGGEDSGLYDSNYVSKQENT
jgi:hypothetical protein